MKATTIIILAILSIIFNVRADNVFLNSGLVYRNVKADTSNRSIILVDLDSRIDSVNKSDVLFIEWNRYSSSGKSTIVRMTDAEKRYFVNLKTNPEALYIENKRPATNQIEEPIAKTNINNYPNIRYLAIGVLGAVIAWDQLMNASDISDQMDSNQAMYKNLGMSVPDQITAGFKNRQSRSYVVGAAAAIVGIVFTIHALKPVEVSVTPDNLKISYIF